MLREVTAVACVVVLTGGAHPLRAQDGSEVVRLELRNSADRVAAVIVFTAEAEEVVRVSFDKRPPVWLDKWGFERYEVVLRSGDCKTTPAARPYSLTRRWYGDSLDSLRETTWSVELYEHDWFTRGRSSPWFACGTHVAGPFLSTNTVPALATAASRRRTSTNVIRVKTRDGTVDLKAEDGGRRTAVLVHYSGAGSVDAVARVRAGTCDRLLAARSMPFMLWAQKDSGQYGGSIDIPVAFRRFRRERFVVEFGYYWFGDFADTCIQLSPVP